MRDSLSLVLVGLVGLVLFVTTFSATEPATRLGVEIGRFDAWSVADEYLVSAGYELGDYRRDNAAFIAHNDILAFLQEYDVDEIDRADLLRFKPSGSWDLLYVRPSDGDRFRFKISPDGHVFESIRTPPNGSSPGRLSQGQALTKAKEFLSKQFDVPWDAFEISEARTIQHEDRIDHLFTWQRVPTPSNGVDRRVFATVQGETVGGWGTALNLPEDFDVAYSSKSARMNFFYIGTFILAAGAWLIALFVFALRFRAREIGMRGGLIAAIALVIVAGLFYTDTISFIRHSAKLAEEQTPTIILYVALVINIFFFGLGVFFVWISGESVAREIWPEKLKVFDGLFGQHFFFKDLGYATLRGASLALVQLGIFYSVSWCFVMWAGAWPIISEATQEVMSSFTPVGLSLSRGIMYALMATSYAFLFGLSLLKKRFGRTWIAVTVTAVVFGFFFLDPTDMLDRWYTGVAGIVAGFAACVYFLRYDLGTVFFGQVFAGMLPVALVLMSQPASEFRLGGAIALATFLVILAGALVLTYRGAPLDEQAVQPRYVQFISERERLKLELDIARRAQLRMLPRTVPDTTGLDIAAYSEPAREVGGDYFDFFRLGANSLGVAIGDVSGKGMPAALYMTMLKGFLQSQANSGASPRDILSSTNRYFHASSESSTFITLLYCVFDLSAGTLTFARAGHYPLLVHRPGENATTILQPPGIGIGLEDGDVFDRVIREESIRLQSGDIVVMFTDGLTEARNSALEEFGQDRIRTVLQQVDGQSAEQILTVIRGSYEVFREGQDAHDDFSCVVVRVS